MVKRKTLTLESKVRTLHGLIVTINQTTQRKAVKMTILQHQLEIIDNNLNEEVQIAIISESNFERVLELLNANQVIMAGIFQSERLTKEERDNISELATKYHMLADELEDYSELLDATRIARDNILKSIGRG